MIVLGLESSCDETAAAVVEGGRRVRSSVVASQHDLHRAFSGVVPELASRAHVERLVPVVQTALDRAGLTLREIEAVAVGHRPGLIGSLLVGVAGAKALAWSLGVPIIGVDHILAHLHAGLLGRPVDHQVHPALGLVISGGHTATFLCRSSVDAHRLGTTIDDAAGEAFDKAAAILGLPYPGGPSVDRLASAPGAGDRAHDLPVSRLERESLDFSFSGLKTALLYAARGVPTREGAFPRDSAALSPEARRDLAASFQRAVCRAVVLKLERALARVRAEAGGCRSLIAGGGVTSNSRLRAELADLARREGLALILPPPDLCVDNAAMIAGLGHDLLASGQRSGLDLQASPSSPC